MAKGKQKKNKFSAGQHLPQVYLDAIKLLAAYVRKWRHIPKDIRDYFGAEVFKVFNLLLVQVRITWALPYGTPEEKATKTDKLEECIEILDLIRVHFQVMMDTGVLSLGNWTEIEQLETMVRSQLYAWRGGEIPGTVRFFYDNKRHRGADSYRVKNIFAEEVFPEGWLPTSDDVPVHKASDEMVSLNDLIP